jgi:hypothetical protein
MDTWALVIGIDRYELPDANLSGASRDALMMREWLVDPAGGNVPDGNVILLLSPREDAEPPGVESRLATQGNILDAIAELIMRSGGGGERLYFFFAGHGVSTFVDASEENALVAADFTGTRTQNSVALRTLWEYFETWQFKDQFFFIDACRNIPVDFDFRVGEWTQPRRRDPGVPPVQQFILYATSPGLRAAETGAPGDERGHFTDALLAGLRGAGAAKAWSRANRSYDVRWDRLVRYVKDDVERRRIEVGGAAGGGVFQVPQESPKRGVAGRDPDPVLSRFPPRAFPPERLTIDLKPEDVYSVAEIIISHAWGEPLTIKDNIPHLPVEFELEPNVYLVRGTAPNYGVAYYGDPLELYTSRAIEVDFVPLAPGDHTVEHAGIVDDSGATAADSDDVPRGGSLVATSSDSLATLELTDAAGRTLHTGTGTAELDDVPAGVYRVKLRTPENEVVEQLVELAPGDRQEISVAAPEAPDTGAVTSFVTAAGGRVLADNTAELHEGGGPVAAPRLSTVLGVAGAAAIGDDASARSLGMRAVPNGFAAQSDGGVSLVLGVDWTDADRARDYLSAVGIRVWRLGEPVPETCQHARPIEKMGFAAEYAQALAPGMYWLALEPPDPAARMVITIAVFPARVTLATVQLGGPQPHIFEYAPSAGFDRSSEPEAVRRLEVMERLLVGGQLGAAFETARNILESPGIVDPLGTSLAAYIALRAGRVADAEPAIERLVDEYGHLSDVHLLRGESDAAAGRPGAVDAFARAVAEGAPVFAEGLTRLLEGLRAYGIEHPHSGLVRHIFERHLTGSMWSAWRPDTLRAGHLLIE